MDKLAGKPFALIGVDTMATDPKKVREVTAREKLNWRSIASTDAIKVQWNNPGTPVYYVIDHRGVIRHKWVGNPGGATIEAALDALIGEVPAAASRPVR